MTGEGMAATDFETPQCIRKLFRSCPLGGLVMDIEDVGLDGTEGINLRW